jgi:hypothetical protein
MGVHRGFKEAAYRPKAFLKIFSMEHNKRKNQPRHVRGNDIVLITSHVRRKERSLSKRGSGRINFVRSLQKPRTSTTYFRRASAPCIVLI